VATFSLSYPVDPPAVITQAFGDNLTGIADFYSRYGLPAHEGVDFHAAKGDRIYAAAGGVVLAIRIPGQGGVVVDHAYGRHVLLKHLVGGQEWQTQYCHLDSIVPGLRVGMPVSAGARLGGAGNSGHVVHSGAGDGAHLHFQLRKQGATLRREVQTLPDGTGVVYPGDLVDPTPFFEI
jgi:murein DD-endopeptidase MepM/ murein hydrolase activator NlpD